jgi:hypothetical protein
MKFDRFVSSIYSTRWDWLLSLFRLLFYHLTCLRLSVESFFFVIFSTSSFASVQLFLIHRLSPRSSRNHYLTLSLFNMIVFMTSLDLMKMITIFMNAINSMIQFVRVINKIIADHVFHHALSFVNDIKVKKSKITYNNEFIFSEIRRYVMKHIQWLNDVLTNIERADWIIFEEKSQFCCEELRVVEFVCDVEERHSNTTKMIKILNWFFCQNVADVREFIEICVFYRVFIADFAFIAQLIYALLKKNVSFVCKLV